jgi:DNA modification methylase
MTKAEQQENGRLLRNYEPDLSPIIPPEVWEIATAAFSEAHFATFPPALVAPCLLAGCPKGGTVLDPFGGAGTTGLVADRMQRNAILIELNPEYAAIAERRLAGDSGLFAAVEVAA